MRHAPLYLTLALIFSSQAFAQSPVADWFPVHVGDKWTYQNESRDGGTERFPNPKIERWKTEETIVASAAIPEGTLIVRRIRAIDPAPFRGPYQSDRDPAYLIRGDCLYVLYPQEWLQSDRQLTPQYHEDLLAGHVVPDYCFPLTVGKVWGAPHWGGWRPPAEAKDWQVAGVEQKIFHITTTSLGSPRGSGMTADIWFEKGVGIVREQDIHHGTYWENQIQLLRFEPAPR